LHSEFRPGTRKLQNIVRFLKYGKTQEKKNAERRLTYRLLKMHPEKVAELREGTLQSETVV